MEAQPKRKKGRLTGYDYSANGSYYITVCTRDKQHILGHSVGGGVLDAPYVRLSKCGAMVRDTLLEMDAFYDEITINHYVIMPNHVHFIVSIAAEGGPMWASAPTQALGSLVRSFKTLSTKAVGQKLWQRGYYDHVIRNEADYLRIWQYMDENPVRWTEDEYYFE